MTLKTKTDHRSKTVDEAAEWFARMQSGDADASELEAFADWLAGSAEHVREYLYLSQIASDIANLEDVSNLNALTQSALDESNPNVIPLRSGSRDAENGRSRSGRSARRWRSSTMGKIAAAALVAIPTLVWFWSSSDPTVFQTSIGQQVSFPLEDNTVVTLNAQSTLHLNYSNEYRDVTLVHGEALFDVAKDPQRPFRVFTGKARISAVGTTFNVRYRQAATTVTVVEGAIEVASTGTTEATTNEKVTNLSSDPASQRRLLQRRIVTAGQQARVDEVSGEVAVIDAAVEQVTSWRERRLVFESRRLSSVVEEINLYNDSKILISDPALRDLEISGSFNANDRESFALFLREAGLSRSIRRSDGAIALVAPETTRSQ